MIFISSLKIKKLPQNLKKKEKQKKHQQLKQKTVNLKSWGRVKEVTQKSWSLTIKFQITCLWEVYRMMDKKRLKINRFQIKGIKNKKNKKWYQTMLPFLKDIKTTQDSNSKKMRKVKSLIFLMEKNNSLGVLIGKKKKEPQKLLPTGLITGVNFSKTLMKIISLKMYRLLRRNLSETKNLFLKKRMILSLQRRMLKRNYLK